MATIQHEAIFSEHTGIPAAEGYNKEFPQANRISSSSSPLTARQLEVLRLLVEGRRSKEIAETLNLSVKTVEAHRSNMLCKLNLHSVTELVRYAMRTGIVAA